MSIDSSKVALGPVKATECLLFLLAAATPAFPQSDLDRCFVTVGLPGQSGATVPIDRNGSFSMAVTANLRNDPVYGGLMWTSPAVFDLTCYAGDVPLFARSAVVSNLAGRRREQVSFVGQRFSPFRERLADVAVLQTVAASSPGALPTSSVLLVDDTFTPQLIARGYRCYACSSFEEYNYLDDGTVFRATNSDIAAVELYDDNGRTAARLVPVSDGIAYITATRYGVAGTLTVIVSIDDPLTTVEGFVTDMDGNRVENAEVTVAEFPGFMTLSGADGFFSIPNVPTGLEDFLTVRASLSGAGFGSVVQVPPVPNGITDAGLVKLDTQLQWLFDAGGSWHDPLSWSGGFVPAADFDVRIDRPGVDIAVSTAGDVARARNLFCSEDLAVSGLLEFGQTLQVTGALDLGGTIAGVVSQSPLPRILPGSTIQSGTLRDLALETNVSIPQGDSFTVEGQFALNSQIRINGGSGSTGSQLTLNGGLLDGTGLIYAATGGGNTISWPNGTTQTIGPDLTVRGRNANIGGHNTVLINEGTIRSDLSGAVIVNATSWINLGLMEVNGPGSRLLLSGDWRNDGVLSVSGGSLELGGTFSPDDIGSLERNGGTVTLGGSPFDNSGSYFALTAETGTWSLAGTILGGTIETLNGTRFDADGDPTLDGVIFGGLLRIPSGEGATLLNDVVLNGQIQINGGGGSTGSRLTLNGDLLAGTGSIYANSGGGNTIDWPNGTTQTIGPDLTIRGRSANIGGHNTFLVNEGTIRSDLPGTVSVGATSWTNRGLMEVNAAGAKLVLAGDWRNEGVISISDGALDLAGTFTPDDIGVLNRSGGVVTLAGSPFDNAGSYFALSADTGSWNLAGTVLGGTVDTLNGTRFDADGDPTLDGVIFGGLLRIPSGEGATLLNDVVLNGQIQINGGGGSTGSRLTLNGDLLAGTGSIYAISGGGNTIDWPNGTTQTIGPDLTIRGRSANIGGHNTFLVNEGTIRSDLPGTVSVNAASWTNLGSMEVNAAGAKLVLAGDWRNEGVISISDGVLDLAGTFTPDDIGVLNRSGGVVTLAGSPFDNAGSYFALSADTGSWNLAGTVLGGTVDTLDGTGFEAANNATLDGVTFDGFLNIAQGTGGVTLRNAVVLNGQIRINGSTGSVNSELVLNGGLLDGTGLIYAATGGSNNITWPNGTTQTIGPNLTIRGRSANIGGSNRFLVNEGTIACELSSGLFSINSPDWSNAGTLAARGGGTLRVASTVVNDGTFETGFNGLVETQSDFMQSPTGTFQVELANTDHGQLAVWSPHTATLDGTIEVLLEAGYVPTAGDAFDVLVADTISGQFATEVLPDLGPGLEMQVEYLTSAVRVRVVAVP